MFASATCVASGPPTNTYGQVAKAFDQGWGGAVWKTIGEPIINEKDKAIENVTGTRRVFHVRDARLFIVTDDVPPQFVEWVER